LTELFPHFLQGAYATFYIIVSPFGAFGEPGKVKYKIKKSRGFHFYEGLTPPSLSLFRPSGFCKKERKKEKSRGFHFNEGLTPPSTLLCRPLGLLGNQER